MSAKIELFVGTPCYGGMLTEDYLHGILELQNFCLENKIGLNIQTLGQESLITRARNTLVANFLDNESFTHLLFIDADIGFEATSLSFISPEEVIAIITPQVFSLTHQSVFVVLELHLSNRLKVLRNQLFYVYHHLKILQYNL